jgi:hypothetical protein
MLTLGGSIHTLNKYKEALLFASKEKGLEVNAEKTKYILMCLAKNAGQNHNIQKGNKSSERVGKLRYLVTTLTDRNSIYEEMKTRLRLKNSCYHWVQSFVFQFAIQNIKIKVYRIITLSPILYE